MKFISDPATAVKIEKMKSRLRSQHPLLLSKGIDRTRFVLDDGNSGDREFSFLVIGDSGSGRHIKNNPQRQIAKQMVQHQDNCRFIMHTGDVIYLVGSSEYYPQNFIEPYHEFIVGGEHPDRIAYNKMVFKLPILPVPGNHDYYDLPLLYGAIAQAAQPLRHLFRGHFNLDVGWHGSDQGKAYARAFLDYLKDIPDFQLEAHFDRHYTAQTDTGRCLRYQPSEFTRLPNRYYTFHYGGIDFFALDSNTFNEPPPLPDTKEGRQYRQLLETRRDELEAQQVKLTARSQELNPDNPNHADQLDELETKLEQIEEVQIDIEKQLESDQNTVTDIEQLNWFKQRLIHSWKTEEVRGRIMYLHHPSYVTEATKWDQGQTLAIRRQLRWVLDQVAEEVGDQTQGRPLLDLVLTGHAHCLEHLQTGDTGHADSHINWIVCGGSGYSLRRQRKEGSDLTELFVETEEKRLVARSKLFVGRKGRGSHKQRPYSFLRVDVLEGSPPKLRIQPMISERTHHEWRDREGEAFII